MTLSAATEVLKRVPSGFASEDIRACVDDLTSIRILKTLWYPEILNPMEESARAYLKYFGIADGDVSIEEVPGAYELPLAAHLAFEQLRAPDFVIALGCVLRGATPHFDFVCSAVTDGLLRVQLDASRPVGFGVLTVDTLRQAEERIGKGAEAAQAAFFMHLKIWKEKRRQRGFKGKA